MTRKSQNKAVFYCSAQTFVEARFTLRSALGASVSAASEERWLNKQKQEYIKKKEPEPEYWDKIRIFRVTIEEVPR